MKPIHTWVLIADGARARIVKNDGPGKGIVAMDGMTFEAEHQATHDLVDDREGRTHQSVGQGRSAIEAHSDPHRLLKKGFARTLADVLAKAEAQKSFDRVVLVAPPVTLGDLREALSSQVRAKVAAEVAQDLTKVPNSEVAKHLADAIVL